MSAQTSETAEPDLTPLLDLVFQLITFFMLVVNFKGAAMDLSLKLPVLGSARPLQWQGQYEPLMLNIDAQGRVQAYGQTVDVEPFVAREASLLKRLLAVGSDGSKDGELPVPVIIRADKSLPFTSVSHVITVCQKQGYRSFSLSAMTRAEDR